MHLSLRRGCRTRTARAPVAEVHRCRCCRAPSCRMSCRLRRESPSRRGDTREWTSRCDVDDARRGRGPVPPERPIPRARDPGAVGAVRAVVWRRYPGPVAGPRTRRGAGPLIIAACREQRPRSPPVCSGERRRTRHDGGPRPRPAPATLSAPGGVGSSSTVAAPSDAPQHGTPMNWSTLTRVCACVRHPQQRLEPHPQPGLARRDDLRVARRRTPARGTRRGAHPRLTTLASVCSMVALHVTMRVCQSLLVTQVKPATSCAIGIKQNRPSINIVPERANETTRLVCALTSPRRCRKSENLRYGATVNETSTPHSTRPSAHASRATAPVDCATQGTTMAGTCAWGQYLSLSLLSPGQGLRRQPLRTRAKRTTGKQGLRYTPMPEAPHYYPALTRTGSRS